MRFLLLLARWVPPPPPSAPVLREGFRFSLPLMEAAFVDYISVTGYVMLVGLRMSVANLAQFRIAQRLSEVLQEVAFMPARKVFMPVLVAVRRMPAGATKRIRQMLDLLSMVIFFVSAVSGAAARPVILLDVRSTDGRGGAGLLDPYPHGARFGFIG